MSELTAREEGDLRPIPGKLTPTSLELPPGLPRSEWIRVGETLKRMERGIQWWVGDWFAYGERSYGEEIWQYLERTEKTLANWASVCRRVDPSRRREKVHFSHHAEVAKLEPSEQVTVLEEVERDELSVTQTRERAQAVEHERVAREMGRTVETYEPAPYNGNGEPVERSTVMLRKNAMLCPHCGEIIELPGDES